VQNFKRDPPVILDKFGQHWISLIVSSAYFTIIAVSLVSRRCPAWMNIICADLRGSVQTQEFWTTLARMLRKCENSSWNLTNHS